MANAELQNLARNYAQGGLTLEDYRLQRSQILNSFSIDLAEDEDTSPTQRTRIIATASDSAEPWFFRSWLFRPWLLRSWLSRSLLSRNKRIMAVILLLVLVGGIGIISSMLEDDGSAIPTSTQPLQTDISITAKRNIPNEKTAVKRLAKQLIKIGNWQQKHIITFQQQWSALTAEEKSRARDTAWFSQLKYGLFHRIAEHRAKASFGGTNAIQQADDLTKFAQNLGIEIPN